MVKVLLFDFDGTIADSFENFLSILKTLSQKYRLPQLTSSEIEALRDEDARNILKKFKIPFYKIPFLARDMKKLQEENISKIHLFKEIPDTLKELKRRKYTIGIITSNSQKNVEMLLRKNKIADVFTYIHSDTSLFGKDKVIKKFMKMHKLFANDVLYIGDEIRDIKACRKAGVKIAAVTWGYNSKKGLFQNNPDYILKKPLDLFSIL